MVARVRSRATATIAPDSTIAETISGHLCVNGAVFCRVTLPLIGCARLR
jgi:hypothetical protein